MSSQLRDSQQLPTSAPSHSIEKRYSNPRQQSTDCDPARTCLDNDIRKGKSGAPAGTPGWGRGGEIRDHSDWQDPLEPNQQHACTGATLWGTSADSLIIGLPLQLCSLKYVPQFTWDRLIIILNNKTSFHCSSFSLPSDSETSSPKLFITQRSAPSLHQRQDLYKIYTRTWESFSEDNGFWVLSAPPAPAGVMLILVCSAMKWTQTPNYQMLLFLTETSYPSLGLDNR